MTFALVFLRVRINPCYMLAGRADSCLRRHLNLLPHIPLGCLFERLCLIHNSIHMNILDDNLRIINTQTRPPKRTLGGLVLETIQTEESASHLELCPYRQAPFRTASGKGGSPGRSFRRGGDIEEEIRLRSELRRDKFRVSRRPDTKIGEPCWIRTSDHRIKSPLRMQ